MHCTLQPPREKRLIASGKVSSRRAARGARVYIHDLDARESPLYARRESFLCGCYRDEDFTALWAAFGKIECNGAAGAVDE